MSHAVACEDYDKMSEFLDSLDEDELKKLVSHHLEKLAVKASQRLQSKTT